MKLAGGLSPGKNSRIDRSSPLREVAFTFLIPTAVLTATFIRIAYLKGEKPGWQSGAKS